MLDNIVPEPTATPGSDLKGSAQPVPVGAGIISPAVIPSAVEGSQVNKFPLLTTILLILLSLAAVLAIYLFLQVRTLTLEKMTPSPSTSASPIASPDPTASWQTFTSEKYTFSFKYPQNLSLRGYGGSQLEPKVADSFLMEGPYENMESQANAPEYSITIDIVDSKPNEVRTTELIISYQKIGSKYVVFKMEDSHIPAQAITNPKVFDQILSTFKFTDQVNRPIITTPKTESAVTSPLIIIGTVPSGWMFEGQFPIEIRDSSDKVIGSGIAKDVPPGSWSSGNDINFSATITFTPSGKSGFIVLLSDNPSGIPEKQLTFKQPISF